MSAPEAPGLDRLSAINADGSRKHIQTADISGRWMTRRRWTMLALIAIYAVMPWIKIDGRPAIQLDIALRKFYLFGSVFNAQDFWRAVFLVVGMGATLLFVTAWLGRAWCGWACPQTVFLEGVYRRIERLMEGPREARIRLAAAPWTAGKIARKATKHGLYVVASLLVAHIFLAFFVSLPATFEMVRHNPRENWTAFLWAMAITGIMYFNFAWFREQLCIVICPYGRLQSALLDRDSLIIGYDKARGEPRGRKARGDKLALPIVQDKEQEKQGDCIDCNRCVTACPTGIDIRNGTQLECVACAQCIDACDDVMRRTNKPEGLIRYAAQNSLEGLPHRFIRPRIIFYAVLLTIVFGMLVTVFAVRTTFEANVLRVRGLPYVMDNGEIRNQFEVHLVNKNTVESTLSVNVETAQPVEVRLPTHELKIASLDNFRLPVFVSVKDPEWKGPFVVTFIIKDSISGGEKRVDAQFLGPVR